MTAEPKKAEMQVYESLADRILAKDSQTLFLIRSKLYENDPDLKRRSQDQAIAKAQAYLKQHRDKAMEMAGAIGFGKLTPQGPSNLAQGMAEWVQKMSAEYRRELTGGQASQCRSCGMSFYALVVVIILGVLTIWYFIK